MIGIRKILIIRAANQAMAFSVPVSGFLDPLGSLDERHHQTLASVLSFVTYASVHPSLDPVCSAIRLWSTYSQSFQALIFTSLAFFNLLRQPLMFLPRALSTLTDAQNAIERLTEVS